MQRTTTFKKSESGNVLFLILIAVALFAALSYVVTQSTRSGGGSTEREKNILSSAQMTQYPTALRTSLVRMILGGTGLEQIGFNIPGDTDFDAMVTANQTNLLVFHPAGGGATYQEAPASLSPTPTGAALEWHFNPVFRVPGVGIDTDGTGNDVIAFLPGVSAGICKQGNDELGVTLAGCTDTAGADVTNLVPEATANMTQARYITDMVRTSAVPYSMPATGFDIDSTGACAGVFDRRAAGCFFNTTTSEYVFYSVLLER